MRMRVVIVTRDRIGRPLLSRDPNKGRILDFGVVYLLPAGNQSLNGFQYL